MVGKPQRACAAKDFVVPEQGSVNIEVRIVQDGLFKQFVRKTFKEFPLLQDPAVYEAVLRKGSQEPVGFPYEAKAKSVMTPTSHVRVKLDAVVEPQAINGWRRKTVVVTTSFPSPGEGAKVKLVRCADWAMRNEGAVHLGWVAVEDAIVMNNNWGLSVTH